MSGSFAAAHRLKPFNTSPMKFMPRYAYGGDTALKAPSLLVDETKWNNGSFLGKELSMNENKFANFFSPPNLHKQSGAFVTVCRSFDLEACLLKVSNFNVGSVHPAYACVCVLCVCPHTGPVTPVFGSHTDLAGLLGFAAPASSPVPPPCPCCLPCPLSFPSSLHPAQFSQPRHRGADSKLEEANRSGL